MIASEDIDFRQQSEIELEIVTLGMRGCQGVYLEKKGREEKRSNQIPPPTKNKYMDTYTHTSDCWDGLHWPIRISLTNKRVDRDEVKCRSDGRFISAMSWN